MKKHAEPSAESLEEIPELDDERLMRIPGRGHHTALRLGHVVTIEPDLWAHFGSAEAINDALRQIVAAKKPPAPE
ncbi:MAG TPA: hypothetical protein VGM90_34090 [Kofleriaceae bacterium]|jgi:hypothetical protein